MGVSLGTNVVILFIQCVFVFNSPDLTPFKNLATKRRSLMLAMTAQSDKEQETAKHPMAM